MVAIQKENYFLPDFKLKIEFSDRAASDEVKNLSDSIENILVKRSKKILRKYS